MNWVFNQLDSSILTSVLNAFVNAFSERFSTVHSYANNLFRILIVIELVLFGLFWALKGGDVASSLIRKILFICFFQFLITQYVWIVDALMHSCVKAGLSGGELEVSQLLDPSALISHGFKTVYEVFTKRYENAGLSKFIIDPFGIMGTISIFVIFITYIVMALQIFLTVVEYYIVTTLAIIFIPFGIIRQVSFLADRAISAIFAVCIKLLVLSFVASISIPILLNLVLPSDDPTLKETISIMVGVLAIALVTMKAPTIATGLVTGSSGIDFGGSLFQSAASMMGVAKNTLSGSADYISRTGSNITSSVNNTARAARLPNDS